MPFPSLSRAIKIFFSYATSAPKDRNLFAKLTTHLSALKRQHLIDEWYDSAISIGNDINQIIESYLSSADIIVLLISADFLASKRCYEVEMQRAIELSKTGAIRLIPVLLRPADWETSPLDQYSPLPPDGTPISNSKNIENALYEVAKGIRKVVEEIANQTGKRPAVPVQQSFCNVPYRDNSFFTDRDQTLAALYAAFNTTTARQTQIVALNGLGGTGKTQVALAYIHHYAPHYQYLLWLHASSYTIFSTEVSALVDQLALPHKEQNDEQQNFMVIRNWLQRQTSWLLVLDAIDDMQLVNLVVPLNSGGHVLLTTRTQTIEIQARTLSIAHMEIKDSILFLLRRARMLSAQDPSLQNVPAKTLRTATTLVRKMGGLPLALDQAGAYLEETGCGLTAYLKLYSQDLTRIKLLSRRGQRAEIHPDSALVTITLAIDAVNKEHSTNLELLRLLAFLQPDAIPTELLEQGANEVEQPLQALMSNPLHLYEALADLHKFSLLSHCTDTTTLTIHRVVQDILLSTLTFEQQRQWASQVVGMVNYVFPDGHFDTWVECERFLLQAQHCATLIDTYQLTLNVAPPLLQRLGFYCYQRACYSEAATYLTQALHLYEQIGQSDTAEAAQTINTLGRLQQRQAHYQEAESFYQRALTLREQLFGSQHSATAESLHNLAALYGEQGQYQQAEQLYLRVLALDNNTGNAATSETAKTLNNLGLVYYQQGAYTQAETTYQRALSIYERSLAPDDPNLAYTFNGLGSIYKQREDYQQAAQYYQRALTIRKATLGDEHPETARSLNKLADIYESQQNYQQAQALYQQALSIAEHTLGSEHPDVALLLNNLAFLADQQERYQEAESRYQRALHIYEQTLGLYHPFVASILNNLGLLYLNMHVIERAEPLLRRALAIRTQALGATHPYTAQSLNNLAQLLTQKQAHTEAEPLFQQAYTIYLDAFGPEHTKVIAVQEKLTALLKQIGQSEENHTNDQAFTTRSSTTPDDKTEEP
jgi:Tfp pilus assembly protein PilF